MKLLSEINEAAAEYVSSQINIAKNLEKILSSDVVNAEQLNETVTQFLTNYSTMAQNGTLPEKDKERVINVFGAIAALANADLQQAFGFDDPDNPKSPKLGLIFNDLYGKAGKEAHSAAEAILNDVGRHPSAKSYREQASQAVNDPTRVAEWAGKVRTRVEPEMNRLLTQSRRQEVEKDATEQTSRRSETMGRPMQGAVPQRAGA